MSSKVHSTRTSRRRAVEGSRNRGKMVLVDLNALPHEHPSGDVVAPPLLSQVDTPLGSATQAGSAFNDVSESAALPSGALIDLEAIAGQAANTPIDVEVEEGSFQHIDEPINIMESAEQPPNTPIYVDTNVIQPPNLNLGAEANILRIPDAPIDDEDDVKILSSSRGLTQVQSWPTLAIPDTIIIDEDCDTNAGPSGAAEDDVLTRLTLGIYSSSENIPYGRTIADSEAHGHSENGHTAKRKTLETSPEPKKEETKEPTFSCAVCWGPLVDETSTICGHIFCQVCIKASIKAQKKCPTCRRPLNMRNIHRVYLPTPN